MLAGRCARGEKMTFNELFSSLSQKMATVEVDKRITSKNFNQQLEYFYDFLKKKEENPESTIYKEGHNLLFNDLVTSDVIYFDQREVDIKSSIMNLYLHKNKQYQWVLVEAYELFEDYLEECFALSGFLKRDDWPLGDCGSETMDSINKKDYSWFLDKAKKKKNIPKSILQYYRLKFPRISTVEKRNRYNLDLNVILVFVEKIRHIIVHCNGCVKNKSEFIKDVLHDCGYATHGKENDKLEGFMNAYFGKAELDNTVMLLELPIDEYSKYGVYVDRVDNLLNLIMAYSYLLLSELSKEKDG